jgi:hypothetical protein
MKVVLATQTYAPVIGGEERRVQNLAGWLAGHGHDVHVGRRRSTAARAQTSTIATSTSRQRLQRHEVGQRA